METNNLVQKIYDSQITGEEILILFEEIIKQEGVENENN